GYNGILDSLIELIASQFSKIVFQDSDQDRIKNFIVPHLSYLSDRALEMVVRRLNLKNPDQIINEVKKEREKKREKATEAKTAEPKTPDDIQVKPAEPK
ncbi:MAG: hypothetical protein HY072_09665, partial [Deltaproteobacteria bacterium]|nr:hypothetical protein [Deltaproteobacteria bacterium]